VIVSNPEIKIHKISASTEMRDNGFKSSNQLDRLKGLLKDEPQKKSYLVGGITFNKIPALSVVKSNYNTEKANISISNSYKAGNYIEAKLTSEKNQIPIENKYRLPKEQNDFK
jgi:hypothetical protein